MDRQSGTLLPETFGPLQGVRILSTGTIIAQPFAAHLAAEMGAEVIQVEHPSGEYDAWRYMGIRLKGENGTEAASSWVQERRNAFYVTLDFTKEGSKDLFLGLIKSCDIWMESSKPGSYDKWGLTDDVVLEANPKIVVSHVSGYGQSGDEGYLGRASYDLIGQAFGGLLNLTGFPDPEPPTRASPWTGDYLTALFCLWSSLAGYIYASRTGKGQVIDVAQFEAIHRAISGSMVEYFNAGVVRERSGNKAPAFQPYDVFNAKDGWVVIGAIGPSIFERACQVIGLDYAEWAGVHTDINSDQGLAFDALLRAWVIDHTVKEAVDAFNANNVPCCPVMTARDMGEDPHYQARGVHVEWDDVQVGRVKGTGVAPKFSETPGKIWRGSVPAGYDNQRVYGDLLGLTPEKIDELRRLQVI